MQAYKKEEVVPMLQKNFITSVERFGEFLAIDERSVPQFIRNQACMRRFSLCFIALFEYLKEASELPATYISEKKPDEIADYFIEKGVLQPADKELFVTHASIYSTIFMSPPGTLPHEEKIMTLAQPIYLFLKQIAGCT